MAKNSFGALFDDRRPQVIIHSSLQRSSATQELMRLAESKGFEVVLNDGIMASQAMIHEGYDRTAPLKNHNFRSAKRFLEYHPGVD